jgi:hypothetical protein
MDSSDIHIINRISDSSNNNDDVLRISINENTIRNPINNLNYNNNNNLNNNGNSRNSENPIRLPSEACIPISGNVSDVSIRSSESRYRESELTTFPKAEILIINNHPIARTIDEPLIPTAEKPKRIFYQRFGTPVISPIRKKQGLWGTCACSFCCLLTIAIYFLIPKYPPPTFNTPILIANPNNNILSLTQYASIFNDNVYSLEVTNWNMNITLQANTGNIITFQSMNNAVTIESRKNGYITLVFNNITNTLAQNCSATIFTITSICFIFH